MGMGTAGTGQNEEMRISTHLDGTPYPDQARQDQKLEVDRVCLREAPDRV